MPHFPEPERRPMPGEFYRCRDCGQILSSTEVYDREGAHYCLPCAQRRGWV